MAAGGKLTKADAVSVEEHEREWGEIFAGISGVIDACAFQDGHLYDRYKDYFNIS